MEVARFDRNMNRFTLALCVDVNDIDSLMNVPGSIRRHLLEATGKSLSGGNGKNHTEVANLPQNNGKVAESGD